MKKFVFLPPQTEATRQWAERLRSERIPGVEIVEVDDPHEAADALTGADAAFGTVPEDLIAAADSLRWLQAPAAAPPPGFYHRALQEHPVVVTNFRGIYSDHVPIHAMALALALARNLPQYFRQQTERTWDPVDDDSAVIHLPEATALIVGVGGIGSALVGYCRAFGMQVHGTDARITEHPGAVIHPPHALDALLPSADLVFLTVPHTPATEGLMNRRRFALMRNTAVLVNIGRGATVLLSDLVDALVTNQIAGAALDVFETEPLPSDHPLWRMRNVILTPHVAATGPYLDDRRYAVLEDNMRRFLAGEVLLNVVDKSEWF